MKKLITIILVIISTATYGQLLSLDQVIALRPKTIAEIEETLTLEKWTLLSIVEATKEKYGTVKFALNKSTLNDNASAFLSLFYQDSLQNRMLIQLNNPVDYTKYLTDLKELGFRLEGSKLENSELIKIYRTELLVIKIRIFTLKEGYKNSTKTYYTFEVFARGDFDTNL